MLVSGLSGTPPSLSTGIRGSSQRLLDLPGLRSLSPEGAHVRCGAAECRGCAGNGAAHGSHLLRQLGLLGVERLQFLHDLPGVTLQAAQGGLPGTTGLAGRLLAALASIRQLVEVVLGLDGITGVDLQAKGGNGGHAFLRA
ncbi:MULTISPECIES: hypothetical protein [Pseudomonas]|uniref:hypothetical protein n=1 Tax=Pseudomonas TaxID=286 RepID=UPI001F1511ED|nr:MULTISPECIES: hypothetical protein [Pseudomonas]WKU97344.1 hypothetical protein Q3407_08685 [Pseudomonas fulva]